MKFIEKLAFSPPKGLLLFTLDSPPTPVHLMLNVLPLSGSLEVKHKLYGSVLIIGGGLSFPGAAAVLQARLELQLPGLFSRSAQTVEVFSNPRVNLHQPRFC